MGHRSVVTRLGPGMVAVTLAVCPMVQAANVNTVFSAENALYGAGYDIGQADGWIDDALTQAVKRYQASRQGLSATGVLDAPTLSSLGISADGASLMKGNQVASRKAAMETLGFTQTESVAVTPAPARQKVAKNPEPQRKTPEKPVTEKKPAPVEVKPVVAEKPVQAPTPAPKPVVKTEPQPVTPPPAPTVANNPTAPEKKVAPRVEQTEQKVTVVPPAPKPEAAKPQVQNNEPDSQPITVAAFSADPDGTAKSTDLRQEKVDDQLPQEPTAAGVESAEEPVQTSETLPGTQPAENTGNVITRMFDFLFGWMV